MSAMIFTGYTAMGQEIRAYIGVGGLFHSHQDARFTNLRYDHLTGIPELGFTSVSDRYYWNVNANGYFQIEDFPNDQSIEVVTYGYNVRGGFLRSVSPDIYVGAGWDVVDYYKRSYPLLANGADAYKMSSDIYASAKYLWRYSDDWRITFGLDYGFFSLVNMMPSFAPNFQQNVVDNGEVTFIDADTRRPFVLRNLAAKGFWDQVNIRTQIQVDYKKRFSLRYVWDMRSIIDHPGYPVTDARHHLTLMFNFISHTRS